MASDDEHLDIMISLHVGSMKASAMNLKETLEAKGYDNQKNQSFDSLNVLFYV